MRSEINVTPLVDVVLVLLIIFMVVTPLLHRGPEIKLPRAAKSEGKNPETDPLVLSITGSHRLFFETQRVDEGALARRLKAELDAHPERKVLVKGDESLTFGEIRRVMNVARAAGAKGVSLGVEEK